MTMSGDAATPGVSPAAQLVREVGQLACPGIVVHGGADVGEAAQTTQGREHLAEGLERALAVGWAVLAGGGNSVRAAVEAVASMEDSGVFNAGRGSVLTTDGTIETDAAVMDGASGAAGAVCAATWPANPIRAALLVAGLDRAKGGPLLLAGGGADRVARAGGLPRLSSVAGSGGQGQSEAIGTVGAVVVDRAGHVAAATSTGGRRGQLPGRVGDTPIFGAGTWADDATAAISATGVGEAFILAGFAHRVDWNLHDRRSLEESLRSAFQAVSHRGGVGGAISVTSDGHFAVMFDTPAMARGWRDATISSVRIARL